MKTFEFTLKNSTGLTQIFGTGSDERTALSNALADRNYGKKPLSIVPDESLKIDGIGGFHVTETWKGSSYVSRGKAKK